MGTDNGYKSGFDRQREQARQFSVWGNVVVGDSESDRADRTSILDEAKRRDAMGTNAIEVASTSSALRVSGGTDCEHPFEALGQLGLGEVSCSACRREVSAGDVHASANECLMKVSARAQQRVASLAFQAEHEHAPGR